MTEENKQKQPTGLILEGGALRGLFTAGVLDVMMERGLAEDFDAVIGVSAGAAFSCNIKSKQIGRVLRYNLALTHDPRYWGLRSLVKTGDLFGAKFCYDTIPNEFDLMDYDTYNANPQPFYIVATDIDTGKPAYYRCHDLAEDLPWMQASASMPLASRPVEIDGRRYLDGGTSDSIPYDYFASIGYAHSVLVLTRSREMQLAPNKLMPLIRRVYRRYPNLVRALETRHIAYNRTLSKIRQLEAAGKIFVIRPDAPLPFAELTRDADKLQAAYDAGRAVTEREFTKLARFVRQA